MKLRQAVTIACAEFKPGFLGRCEQFAQFSQQRLQRCHFRVFACTRRYQAIERKCLFNLGDMRTDVGAFCHEVKNIFEQTFGYLERAFGLSAHLQVDTTTELLDGKIRFNRVVDQAINKGGGAPPQGSVGGQGHRQFNLVHRTAHGSQSLIGILLAQKAEQATLKLTARFFDQVFEFGVGQIGSSCCFGRAQTEVREEQIALGTVRVAGGGFEFGIQRVQTQFQIGLAFEQVIQIQADSMGRARQHIECSGGTRCGLVFQTLQQLFRLFTQQGDTLQTDHFDRAADLMKVRTRSA